MGVYVCLRLAYHLIEILASSAATRQLKLQMGPLKFPMALGLVGELVASGDVVRASGKLQSASAAYKAGRGPSRMTHRYPRDVPPARAVARNTVTQMNRYGSSFAIAPSTATVPRIKSLRVIKFFGGADTDSWCERLLGERGL